jgi:hypothetical protein
MTGSSSVRAGDREIAKAGSATGNTEVHQHAI